MQSIQFPKNFVKLILELDKYVGRYKWDPNQVVFSVLDMVNKYQKIELLLRRAD